MNQILTTKPVKPRKNVKIKTVKTFFAISIMIFGACMITSGSYAMYKNRSDGFNRRDDNDLQSNTVIENTQNSDDISITLSIEGAYVHATLEGENEISFVTYKWDEEEENREDINSTSDKIEIEVPEGEHTITITAVDINNNSKTITRRVKGVVSNNANKPKVNVVQDGSQFLVTASDEVGLDKVTFILNGVGYLVRVEGEKEKEFRYDLEEGDNTLEVTAYNVDGETETFNAICHN